MLTNMKKYLIDNVLCDLEIENIRLHKLISDYTLIYAPQNLKELLDSLSINTTSLFNEFLSYCSNNANYFKYFPEIYKLDLNKESTIESIIKEIFKDTTTLENKYSLYWIAKRFTFTHECANATTKKIQETYKYILEENQKLFNLTINEDIDTTNTKKRIFIYITQYLSYAHSPSKVATLWARSFQELGYTVLIVSCIPFPHPYPFYRQNTFSFNKVMNLADVKKLESNILVMEVGGDLFLNGIYENFLAHFNITKNDRFLLVGESCLHFDILPHKNKYIVPTAFPGKVVQTTATTYIINKKLELRNINGYEMNYLEGPNDYTDENNLNFNTNKIKINKEIKAVIIGHRLDLELDNNFWKGINLLVEKIPNIKLYFIGGLSNENIPKKLIKYIELIGYQKDLSSFIQNMHFYINPERKGGGQSAIVAIKLGIPVITLPDGDVFSNIDKLYHINSLLEIKIFIDNYVNNQKFKNIIDNHNYRLSQKYNSSSEIMLNVAKNIMK